MAEVSRKFDRMANRDRRRIAIDALKAWADECNEQGDEHTLKLAIDALDIAIGSGPKPDWVEMGFLTLLQQATPSTMAA
jgi:hypothetical protein